MRRAASAGNHIAPTSRRRAEQQDQRRSKLESAIRCGAKLAGSVEQPTNSKMCWRGGSKVRASGRAPFHSTAPFGTSRPAGCSRNRAGCLHRADHQNVRTRTDHGRPSRRLHPACARALDSGQMRGKRTIGCPRTCRCVLRQVGDGNQCAASNTPNMRERSTKCGAGQGMVPWYQTASARRCWTCPGGTCGPIGTKLCAPRHVSDLNQRENSTKS